MMRYVYLFTAGIAVALIVLGGNKLYYSGYEAGKRENQVTEVRIVDTVFLDKKIYLERIKTNLRIDTITIKEYVYPEYTAQADTALSDSTLDLIVQYKSPLPLSDDGYFNIYANVRERQIQERIVYRDKEIPVPAREQVWGAGITFSAGYGFYRQKPDLHIGLGIYYKLW